MSGTVDRLHSIALFTPFTNQENSKMLRPSLLALALACSVTLSPVLGQTSVEKTLGEYFTITVTGEAKGKPDLMVLEPISEATAGNASDALSQCKSKADVACDAVAALGIPDSEIVREMYEFSSPGAASPYTMMQPAQTLAGVNASQVIRVKVRLGEASNTDTLAGTISQVLDAANKAGVGFRQARAIGRATASPVSYLLEDATILKMKAIDDCLGNVAQIKNALAKSGVAPGKLVGIGYRQTNRGKTANPWMAAVATPESKSAISNSPNEVTVRTSLDLRFSIQD